ncbi:hypothetical protein QIA36_06780 (plasmid) [Borreliella yangtzensis]|uniref:hypothetical protein n=1 Tax=Borreliella yangtzensis TaxID=683292 RepID=UPI003B21E90E
MRKISLLAFLFVLIGCDFRHIRDTNKFSVGMEHLVNDFDEYVDKKRLKIEEKYLLEKKEEELLEIKRREQLENEAKDRYSSEEFKQWTVKYFIREYQDKIRRLEKEIEEETLRLNFFIENGHKRGWGSNVYKFHLDEIKRLTNEKKESSSMYYFQLKDNSIKYHQVYIDAIELKFPNIKNRLIERYKANIERYKANIERYKANIERYKNEIKILYEVEKKDLINKTEIFESSAEFAKFKYCDVLEENKNSIEIWKDEIENHQYSIICYEVECSKYNKLKSEGVIDSSVAMKKLQNIKNSIENYKLEIKRLENIIQKKESYNKELEEKLKKLENKEE